jgi:hypothetical protein
MEADVMKMIVFLLAILLVTSCGEETPCNCNCDNTESEGTDHFDDSIEDETAEKQKDQDVDEQDIDDQKVDEQEIPDEDSPDEDVEESTGDEADFVVDEEGGSKTPPEPVEGGGNLGDMLLESAMNWFINSGFIFEKGEVFSISYSDGYNINFEITRDQARELLPDNIRPVKLKILENEKEPKYYISLYLAGMESSDAMERADVFTYGMDHNDELTMFFLAGVMELPDRIKNSDMQMDMFERVLDHMAKDSRTGEAAYPHYYSDNISSDEDTLIITYEDARVELKGCEPLTVDNRFSLAFVLVNSQIYRTDIDRNVNYFNQSFINAKVAEKDLNCVEVENPEKFHPMLKKENLMSVQRYGSKNRQIRWYFEM